MTKERKGRLSEEKIVADNADEYIEKLIENEVTSPLSRKELFDKYGKPKSEVVLEKTDIKRFLVSNNTIYLTSPRPMTNQPFVVLGETGENKRYKSDSRTVTSVCYENTDGKKRIATTKYSFLIIGSFQREEKYAVLLESDEAEGNP